MSSVFSQTSLDFEYIIIDGGSVDRSLEVIKSYTSIPPGIRYAAFDQDSLMPEAQCHMRITYWISEPDNGIYHAMNKGILMAKGEYCQFLNSGDYIVTNDVIEKILHKLDGYSIIYGNMIKQLPSGKLYRDKGPDSEISMLTFYKGTLNHSSAFIKWNLFKKYGLYDENLKIVSDWKWFVNVLVLKNETLKHENIDITCFNMSGISNTNPGLEKEERRKVLEELLPANILLDYDVHWYKIDQINRINRFKATSWLFWFVERIIFKFDKIIVSLKKL